jgi:phosphoribosylformylglycinamidine synthase
VCTGAKPLAVTDCLNFGNPEKAEIYYQLEQAVLGISEACRILGTPVVSGNVSLYNETNGEAVYPTPVIGMLGLVDDASRRCDIAFKDEGDLVVLIGDDSASGLGASEYLEVVHQVVAGTPKLDLDLERRVQRVCLEAIEHGLLRSAHDCSLGGIAVALARCAIEGNIGASIQPPAKYTNAADWLFNEGQSRIVATVSPSNLEGALDFGRRASVPVTVLGKVGNTRLVVGDWIDLDVSSMSKAWEDAIPERLGS